MLLRALVLVSVSVFAADEKPAAAIGPWVRFTGPDSAVVKWETDSEQIGSVEFGETTAFGMTAADEKATKGHAVTLRGLKRGAVYYYRLKFGDAAGETLTLETDFNFTKPPLPDVKPFGDDAEAATMAARILSYVKIRRGYALVKHGCETLAFELVKQSEWSVLFAAEDEKAAGELRVKLDGLGIYGNRIQVIPLRDGTLPVRENTFNVVAGYFRKQDDWMEYVAPGGMRWNRFHEITSGIMPNRWKPQPEGTGAWSHAYGDAGQSANSGDSMVNGRTLALKWFGEPGARGMMDRQPRNPPPLCVNGTFFIQGNDRIFALDAWNGSFLWSLEIPGLRRVNIPRDCSNMCADDDKLHVAVRDRVWRIGARSGEVESSIPCGAPGRHWGYVAVVGDQLFGSTVKPGASYTRFEGGEEFWYDARNERSTAKVLSDSIFTFHKAERAWTHMPRGLVINSTITIGGGRMYFIESRGLGPLEKTPGRLESPALYKDTWLVALNTETGKVAWEKPAPLALLGTAEALYLCYADEKLVLLDSARQTYYTFAYSAKDGAELWRRAQPWARDHHGGHLYHPVLVQGMAVVEPFGYDLATGDIRLRDLPERGGCTTLSAAAECLHFINWDYDKGSLYVRDFADGKTRQFSGSRGNCWLSFISGSGMMMLPAASGGCSCRYPNQATLGFGPGK
jgi:outer membrane protein assembly factor BamB